MRHFIFCLLAAGCGSSHPTPMKDLSVSGGADLAGVDLAGVDLAGVDLAQSVTPGNRSPAAFAQGLGRSHFLVGMGNDGTNSGDDPAYSLGPTIDLHYHYLTGISTEGGWTTWNSNPDYAGKRIAEAVSHGVVPMLTYYCMVAHGEDNLPGSVGDASYMGVYWKDYAQLLATVAAANTPVLIHVEPDFWGYLQQASIDAGSVGAVPAKVAASNAAECSGLPETIVGFGKCLVAMARSRAPKALIGFHASGWSSKMDVLANSDKGFDVLAEAQKTVTFLQAVGGGDADFIASDLIDRDAGCYDVGYTDSMGNQVCSVRPGTYWDETNQALPDFHQAWSWAKAIGEGLDLPVVWWQLPFGTPSTTPGGTPGHFRDNRVHYMFANVGELVAAHGVGMAFGTGAGGQTDVTTDGNSFKTAVTGYFANPTAL